MMAYPEVQLRALVPPLRGIIGSDLASQPKASYDVKHTSNPYSMRDKKEESWVTRRRR